MEHFSRREIREIGEQFRNRRTIYLGQRLNFRAPVRPGQTVHACVTVHAIDLERRRVTLETVCRVGGTVVIDGEALVMTTTSAKRKPAVVISDMREPSLA